ncbi:MAG: hypothetical protein JXR48_12565 [Candidatus Delongbacteria bacterium]|nr:hypothetical protein [Candidatus Delongbacteria bacterium]MBN2835784.1 hypothetical protein [Candidatus Delongbacteria bacterium]
MTTNKKLIIFTHGTLGKILLETALLISGESKFNILTISNTGLDLKDAVKLLDSSFTDDEDVIVLTDFPGGSCFMASKIVSKTRKLYTICGVNLSMIISFITKQNSYTIDELNGVIKNDGHRAIDY